MAYVGKITDTSGTTGLVGSTLYGTCDTAAATAAKVVTLSAFDKLLIGVTVHVRFKYSNTASNPTLNINSTGAKTIARYGIDGTIVKPGTTVIESWPAGAIIAVTYAEVSGTGYWVLNDQPALTTTSVGSATAGTAIAADDITAWSAGTLPSVTVETIVVPNVTSVGTLPSLTPTEKTIPNVTSAGTAPSMTKSDVTVKSVKTINNAVPSATISEGVLTIATPTATVVTEDKTATYISAWSAGSATTLGTAIKVNSADSWSAGTLPVLGTAITFDAITTDSWDPGTLPSLSYTARSIPNISVSSKTVVAVKS